MSNSFESSDVSHYAQTAERMVPGLQSLYRMTGLLVAETMPDTGRLLVLGAGGGQETIAFAQAQPGWRFVGVDPSAKMLQLARDTLGSAADRVEWVEGLIDSAPLEAFDAASCLLTLHFLTETERMHTLLELRRRLKPGGALVVAHHSFPQSAGEKARWLQRFANHAFFSGLDPADAARASDAISARLPLLAPQREVELLEAAGFCQIELFYAALTFKGWVARTPSD